MCELACVRFPVQKVNKVHDDKLWRGHCPIPPLPLPQTKKNHRLNNRFCASVGFRQLSEASYTRFVSALTACPFSQTLMHLFSAREVWGAESRVGVLVDGDMSVSFGEWLFLSGGMCPLGLQRLPFHILPLFPQRCAAEDANIFMSKDRSRLLPSPPSPFFFFSELISCSVRVAENPMSPTLGWKEFGFDETDLGSQVCSRGAIFHLEGRGDEGTQ